jgi:subtilase family serine protease
MHRLTVELLEDRSVPAAGVTNPNVVGLTPAQVQHAYGFDEILALKGNYNSAGSGQTIAIVMAGHDPNITSDLRVFSAQFKLPNADFVQLNQKGLANGSWPKVNADWAGEISLDVEWAHAIAPSAKIVLVEANSANPNDLAAAIDTARRQPGVSAVSMSWGLLQGTGMDAFQKYFITPPNHGTPITFVASTLDNGLSFPNGLYWPSVSPNVIAVGGTSMTVTADGTYVGETGWGPSTGGISTWFAQPEYQQPLVTQSSQYRTVPDVSYHADNSSEGFAVYDTVRLNGQTGWFNAYGDSAGAPQWAALVTIANQIRAENQLPTLDGRTQVLPGLYALAGVNYSAYYHDITTQTGATGKYSAGYHYDLVTGLGTPKADALVPALALLGTPSDPSLPPPPPPPPPSGGSSSFSGSGVTGGGFGMPDTNPVALPLPPQSTEKPGLAAAAEHVLERFAIYLPPSNENDSPWKRHF